MLLLSLNLFRLISSQHYSTPPYIVASEKNSRRRITLQLHRTLYTQICSLVKWKINFSCDFSNKNTIFYYFHGKSLSSLDKAAAVMYNCITKAGQEEEQVMAWNFFGGIPIYIQIAARIRLKIFSGEYPEGSRIPSVRDIASEASANPNTVVKALSMLCDEGIIYPKSTAGNFVTEDKNILDAAREAEAVRITEGYANAIAQLGFSREKTEALLEKYLRKDEANGNNI